MQDIPLKQIIETSLSKIGNVADVNTVIGEPITTADGVTVIPFSKVSVGYVSGGADYRLQSDSSAKEEIAPHFAGANGAGVTITPLGFIVIDKNGVRILDTKHDASFEKSPEDPVNKIVDGVIGVIDKTPVLIDKIKGVIAMFDKDKKQSTDTEVATVEEK